METLALIVALFAVFKLHSKVEQVANHRRELRLADATERMLRWFLVVTATWFVAHLLLQ
jgi:hypothetical protein